DLDYAAVCFAYFFYRCAAPRYLLSFPTRRSSDLLIDSLAPLFWVRADAPPMTLITGDRELEMLGRYEENAYLARMLRIVGHKEVRLYEIDGYDHGVTLPAYPILLKQVAHWTKEHDAKR